MPKTNVTLDTSKLDSILRNLDSNVANAIAKVGFAMEGRTKVNIQQMDAVDTGALLNSVYTSLANGSDGNAAIAEARSRRPGVEINELPVPRENHTAYVGPSVSYAAEVHFGSGTRAGRPFLLQAVRDTEKDFLKMVGEAVTDGR